MNQKEAKHQTKSTEGAWILKSRVREVVLLVATCGGVYICYLLALPFLAPLTLAVVLAILWAPAHKAIEAKLRRPNLAATVSVVIVAVVVVLPIIFVVWRLISEAAKGAIAIQAKVAEGSWRTAIGGHPWIASIDTWLEQQIDLPAMLGKVAFWLTNVGASFARGSLLGLIEMALTFYLLFYFLRDRAIVLETIRNLSPLSRRKTNRLFDQIGDTVHATIYGRILVAAAQGTLGGLMFWWLGLATPVLWGLIMALLAVVPALGAFIVWIPAAIILALAGSWEKAIILSLWGGLVVSTVDNILYPMLVGDRLKLHTVPAFISLVGGLSLLGPVGVILGPVAMTLTILLLDFWRARDEGTETTDRAQFEQRAEKPWHCASPDEVLERLGVSANGLSTEKAFELLAANGPNTLKEVNPIRPFAILFAQFKSILIWILIVASIVSGFLGDPIDAIIILAIVFMNAVVGFYQEFSAERSIAALMRMTAPRAKVWRDGVVTTIASAEVVPGDILELEAGDLVAADARLLNAASLTCVEAALTGESEAVVKSAEALDEPDLPIGDRKNMVFMGTSVTTGSGRAVVVSTAMQTEFGAIASLLDEAGEEAGTPLQQRLEAFGRILLWATLAIVSLLFGLGLWRGGSVLDLFMTSVSLAVAAIPESLPAVVTAALSLGVMRMSRRRALVRRLASVETLGSTNVICTDKTGTLTVGQMTARSLFVGGRTYEVTGEGYGPEGDIRIDGETIHPNELVALTPLSEIMVGCNNASLEQEGDAWKAIGDPTEGALLSAGLKMGADKDRLERDQPKIFEIPFDSNRKLHSVVRRLPDGRLRVLTNGAPEVLLERCSHVLDGSGVRQITASDREEIARWNSESASRGLRVLGSAFRDFDPKPIDRLRPEAIECNLVFVGQSGLSDPPRPEVKDAIAKCQSAGVRVVVITGDHPRTAAAIGREIGIDADSRVLSGTTLNKLSDDDLARAALDTAIYARVSATHKLRIVRAWQANNAVVAMTGDGVNDAPAIKGADIGVAMGRTGTEVTKQASDMIITDDNFATIVAAIEQGRGIYENIRKTLLYLLACNSGELLFMTICIVMGLPAPLLPIHLLWINLITDGPPALCLAADPVDASVMSRRPRDRNKEIADEEFLWTMFLVAVPTAGVSFAAYAFGLQYADLEIARTYAFMAMVLSQLFTALSVRSRTPIWRQSLFANTSLLIVVVASISVQLSIQQNGFFAGLLKTVRIPFENSVKLLAVAIVPLLALELVKFLQFIFAERTRDGPGPRPEARARNLNLIRGSTIGVFAITAAIGAWLYWFWQQAPQVQSTPYENHGASATRSVTANGFVSSESIKKVVTPVPGIIESLYCRVGAEVSAGQLCAKIDPRSYEAVVERAKAALAMAKAKLEKDTIELTHAKSALERNKKPARRYAKSRRKLGRVMSAYQRGLARLEQDETLIAQRKSELHAAEVELEQTNIVSPVAGIVVAQPVEIGHQVEAGAGAGPLFVIALPNAQIVALIREKDLTDVKVGDPVSVTPEPLPNHNVEGTVAGIRQTPITRQGSEVYEVFINAPNRKALVMPETKVTVRIAIPRKLPSVP